MKRASNRVRLGILLAAGVVLIAAAELGTGRMPLPPVRDPVPPGPRAALSNKIVAGAREEVARGVRYDASYQRLSYPGGDVPADRGACTDVLVRALRRSGYDLQKLMHEDMRRRFELYPKKYGLRKPDPSIDHRRAANHVVFLRRHGLALPRGTSGAAVDSWKAGDLVYWGDEKAPWHCGVVSDRRGPRGLPLVIHNIGGAREEDVLDMDRIAGHFRFPARQQEQQREL
ncbi:MAG: hypothetical protein K0Q72_3842 [Armatimonadetes bacterium]|jgi:uncharacterized protein YijF (DUF1287 family)|nr:hypothetical protein [Armatimonadota bacterium]